MEELNEVTEPTLEQTLGLPENASKQQVNVALDDHNRRNRAFSLNLPLASPWSQLSSKYIKLREEGIDCFGTAQTLDDGTIRHPVSKVTVNGTLIERDLTLIEQGDLCACYDGTWKPCFVEGLLYRSCSGTTWVRP